MSLSEIFNHGAPHPWANLRINNLTVDGTIINTGATGVLAITFGTAFPNQVFNVDYVKIGNQVTLNFPDIQSSNGLGALLQIIAPAGSIPVALIPDFVGGTEIDVIVRVMSGGAILTTPGLVQFAPDGSITISSSLVGGGFLLTGSPNTRGPFAFTFSYKSAT